MASKNLLYSAFYIAPSSLPHLETLKKFIWSFEVQLSHWYVKICKKKFSSKPITDHPSFHIFVFEGMISIL